MIEEIKVTQKDSNGRDGELYRCTIKGNKTYNFEIQISRTALVCMNSSIAKDTNKDLTKSIEEQMKKIFPEFIKNLANKANLDFVININKNKSAINFDTFLLQAYSDNPSIIEEAA